MLRTLIGVAVACLLGGLLQSTPAHAAGKVVLARPVASDGAAQLSGRAKGYPRVVLQQRRAGRWQDVRRLKVRNGRYQSTVVLADGRQVFRTRAGSVASRARVVPAKPPREDRDACGAKIAKPGGGSWTCTFVDDFDGTALDRTKWVPQTVFATGDALSGYACYDDDPSVVSVGGGTLNLSVRRDASASPCHNGLLPTPYRAGMVSTYHIFSQQYGRFEARFRSQAATAPGLQEAWWLWPDDRDPLGRLPWPLNGEIDIAETYSSHPQLAVPFLHYAEDDNGGPLDGVNTAWDCAAPRGVYNTYTLEWTASRLEVLVNGRTCLVNTSADSAFQKRYILNLTQALGTGENALTSRTPLPATMNVDYVRVWK